MIYTSNFSTVKNDSRGLAICRSQPKWWSGEVEIRLAPATWEMVRMKDWEKFIQMFALQVKKLDVHEMAKICEGRILLCWENIEKEHCHRELILRWFKKNGYECEEYKKELDNTLKLVQNDSKPEPPKEEQIALF
jgi:hypothetical protein